METIPLLPLTTVLLPHGRMQLQIFEPRYLDLVSRSLKHGSGFGVVWLREGSEVFQPDGDNFVRLAQIGCYATIVDWDSLANGLLGITIDGHKKFRLISSYQQKDHLNLADIEWVGDEPVIEVPAQSEELQQLLSQLLQHPHVERMKLKPEVTDASTLGCLLCQLLPIDESIKFQMLTMNDPVARLQQIVELLDQFSH